MLRTDHPLTDGVEGFWLPVHGRQGGSRLYDLSGRGRNGHLTLMDPSTDWGAKDGTAWPVLRFAPQDSQDQRVQCDPVPTYDGGSVAFYARVWADAFGTSAGNGSRHQIWHHVDSSGTSFAIFAENDGTLRWHYYDGSSARGLSGVHQLPTGQWLDIVCTYDHDSGDWVAWVNGTEVERVADSVTFTVDGADFYIGNHTGEQRTWDGWIAASGFFFRASDLAFATALRDQARRGFPDLLRRDESALYVSTAGAVTFSQDTSATATASGQNADLTLQQAITFPQGDIASAEAQGRQAALALQAAKTWTQDTEATAGAQAKTADIALQAALTLSQDTPATALVEGRDGDIVLVAAALTFGQDSPATVGAQADPGGLTLQQALSISQDSPAAADGQANTADILRQAAQQIQQDIAAEATAQAQIAGIDAQSALVIAQDDSATAEAEARVVDLRLDRGTLATLDITMSDAFTIDAEMTDALRLDIDFTD